WGMFAVHVDPARQVLWATTAAVNAAQGYSAADSGRSALLAYDLATGALRARLEPSDARRAHVLGDMTIGADGRREAAVRGRLRTRHRRRRPLDQARELARPPGQRRARGDRRSLSRRQHAARGAERDHA